MVGTLYSSIALYVFVMPCFRWHISKAYCYCCFIFSFGVVLLCFGISFKAGFLAVLRTVLRSTCHCFLWQPDFHTSIGVWVRSV